MKYRTLGNTGIRVSEIGFGCWGIGGLTKGATSYGKTDDQESLRTLYYAFNSGVTFFDTADIYGNGHSEEILGRAFYKQRDKIIIATKTGFLEHSGSQNFSPAYLRTSLSKSLRRLRTDYVDIYQLHNPSIEFLLQHPEIIETLNAMRQEGKILTYGISVRHPDDGLSAIKNFDFKIVQANFNMIDQRIIENGLLDLAKKNKVGIIARTPLCFGFLSDKYSGATVFGPRDHRSAWPKKQLERWAQAAAFFRHLNNNSRRTVSQLALQFCLSHPAVSTVIPGMMTAQEVKDNIAIEKFQSLNSDELSEIQSIYKNNSFFVKSARRKTE